MLKKKLLVCIVIMFSAFSSFAETRNDEATTKKVDIKIGAQEYSYKDYVRTAVLAASFGLLSRNLYQILKKLQSELREMNDADRAIQEDLRELEALGALEQLLDRHINEVGQGIRQPPQVAAPNLAEAASAA